MPLRPSRFATLGDNVRASIFMTLAMAAFAFNDVLVKIASQSLEPMQIMAVRGVMASMMLVSFAAWRGASLSLGILREPVVLLRALADILTTICYISALRYLPLANASAIFQALPLVITLGATLFLGERVGWRRWAAIAVGFVGVLVILAPGPDGFSDHALWVLASVVFAAVRDLVTRRMPASISSPQIASVTSVAVMITGFLMVPAVGWHPLTGELWIVLAAAAFATATGYALIVASVRMGDLSVVAPFRYTVLLFSVALGVMVFAERPETREMTGALIIVGSGLYTIHRESKKAATRPPSR